MALPAGRYGVTKKQLNKIKNLPMNTIEMIEESVQLIDEQKADNSIIAPVENGTTASQAYAVGEHFIRNGKFCTVTQAIASGDTLTVNTNYVEGTIGDIVYIKLTKTNQSIAADSFITVDFDDLITFSNYEILQLTTQIRGTGASNGIATWAYASNKQGRVVIKNPTNDEVSWTIYGFITLKIS